MTVITHSCRALTRDERYRPMGWRVLRRRLSPQSINPPREPTAPGSVLPSRRWNRYADARRRVGTWRLFQHAGRRRQGDSMNMQAETSARQLSVIADMAERFGMERRAFEATLMATVMPAGGKDVSQEQVAAFLLVAKKYDLNPFTKEIYAFPAKGGGIQTIVSIDGWLKIINDHPQFDGMEFDDKFDATGNLSSVTCRMFRRDRNHPVVLTEYMAECRRPTEPWKQWPARMLRHKAAIQASRYAFGFSGIMDPDEAERMEAVTSKPVVVMPRAKSEAAHLIEHVETTAQGQVIGVPAEPAKPQEPGIHGLSDSLIRVLVESAKQAGITQEQLLDRYPRIDPANYKAVRAELQAMASAK